MFSFENLKRNSSSSESSLEELSRQVNALDKKSSFVDDRYWKPEIDKAGNGYAIIRFLPPSPLDGENALPFVSYHDHGFEGVGGWYIERCLTSLGNPDPACEYNSKLWATEIKANQEIASKQKRRLKFISNIYVIKDPKRPENEGKVFLFSYGKKIMAKITSAMKPEFEDEIAFDPFNFWKGANFKLKIRKVEGHQNYDTSEFDSPKPLMDSDDEIEAVWKNEYSLSEVVSPKNYKTYDELKTTLDRVLGLTSANVSRDSIVDAIKHQNIETEEANLDSVFNTDDPEEMDFYKNLLAGD